MEQYKIIYLINYLLKIKINKIFYFLNNNIIYKIF